MLPIRQVHKQGAQGEIGDIVPQRQMIAKFVLLGFVLAAGVARAQQDSQRAAPSVSVDSHDSAVRLDVPRPSPQQFPPSSVLPAGVETSGAPFPGTTPHQGSESPNARRHGEFVIAPIPFSNQVFSFGLAPVVQYVFHVQSNDQKSPPSFLVLTGMFATGGSWALGGGGSLYLKQDRFRLTAFGGHGSIKYDVFGVGNQSGDQGKSVPIQQAGDLVLLEFLFRLGQNFFVGPRFNYRNLSAILNLSNTGVPLPDGLDPSDLGAQFAAYAPGFKVLHDTRSDLFYPTHGNKIEFVADFFDANRTSHALPSKGLNYQTYQPSYNQYLTLTATQVLAVRGMLCAVNGDPPFYELCQFGSLSDIRGYQPGRYRDRRMFAAQAEYRKILSHHWGFVVFAGLGEVAHAWDSFTTDNLLPAGGTGIRFNLSKKERINLRADVAYGENGWAWNFSLGEAF